MGSVPLRGGSGNFRPEFHYPVVGQCGRKAPASPQTAANPAPDRSRERTTRHWRTRRHGPSTRPPRKPVKDRPLMRSWASRTSPPSMSLGTPQWRRRWHRQLRASLISLSPWTWTPHQQNIRTRCSRMMNRNYWEWPRDRTLP